MTSTEDLMRLALDLAGWVRTPSDCGIYYPGTAIKRLLVGLDISSGDLLIAKEMGFDAVLAHHFAGCEATLTAWQVYRRHTELMVAMGVPRLDAEAAVEERVQELRMLAHTTNYNRTSGAARLLEIPFLNIHSPLDELARQAMQQAVDDLLQTEPDATVAEVAAHLNASIYEFQLAPTRIAIRHGDADAPARRVVVAHGALASGGANVARAYYEHGVDTVIYIDVAPAEVRKLNRLGRGHLIVTGHVAGDSVGINAYLAEVERRGVEVVRLNGIIPPEDEEPL